MRNKCRAMIGEAGTIEFAHMSELHHHLFKDDGTERKMEPEAEMESLV